MGHNLTFDRHSKINYCIFVVTFVLLFHVGHGLDCSWTQGSDSIGAGTHSVPESGCTMKQMMEVRVVVTINGEIGTHRELEAKHDVGKHRHFQLWSPGKLSLNYLKLTWGESGTFGSGGFISMNSGTLAINLVHFDGSKTTESHAAVGGCIHVYDGTVTIKKSTFEGFSASQFGGAMYVKKTSTPMTIESTTFKNNEATVRFIYRLAFI